MKEPRFNDSLFRKRPRRPNGMGTVMLSCSDCGAVVAIDNVIVMNGTAPAVCDTCERLHQELVELLVPKPSIVKHEIDMARWHDGDIPHMMARKTHR